jgi:predicted ABC-class ATPase
MSSSSEGDAGALRATLHDLDNAGYGGYKRLRGSWEMEGFRLTVDRVQADPFAPPSRLEVAVPADVAGLPAELLASRVRRRALEDYLIRAADEALDDPAFAVDAGSQEVIERSACDLDEAGRVVLRFGVGLPANGRKIKGRQAARLLCDDLPDAVHTALRWDALDGDDARDFVACVEDQVQLRAALDDHGLVAFVADGAVLPRRSGVDDRPLATAGTLPFTSPESLRTEITLDNAGEVTGMGVPAGVTLVAGGGYHGKSTLLRALERGVYDHIPDDGRELVATRADAAKIRAEDGRRVERVDISGFVGDLPTGDHTTDFSSDNASGSTSQAANIAEALEVGAGVLLIDEDTAATNLMIRDLRMQQLVAKEAEPLTPFVDLIRPLHREHEVSTVLVVGGAGDYFTVADQVVLMEAFRPFEVTEQARKVAADQPGRNQEADHFPAVRHRTVDPWSVDASHKGKRKLRSRGLEALQFGSETIDLSGLGQLVDQSQVTGVGLSLARLVDAGYLDGAATVAEALDALDEELAEGGVTALRGGHPGDVALPRFLEIAAALNRLRSLRVVGVAPRP